MVVLAGPPPNSVHPPVMIFVAPGHAVETETPHPPAQVAEFAVAVTNAAGLNCFSQAPDWQAMGNYMKYRWWQRRRNKGCSNNCPEPNR